MRALLFYIGIFLAVFPHAGEAEQNTVLVELFTSQGCSSCPPADKLLPQLAGLPGVVALALHVDYWDYLGWKDSFGSPRHTARQRKYARSLRRRSVYTPQIVVQGTRDFVGHKASKIVSDIERLQSLPPAVILDAQRTPDGVEIGVAPRSRIEGPFDIHIVHYMPVSNVAIEGGENVGKTISYTNIVTDWTTVARWNGVQAGEFHVPGVRSGPAVIIVQAAGIGPVVAVMELP